MRFTVRAHPKPVGSQAPDSAAAVAPRAGEPEARPPGAPGADPTHAPDGFRRPSGPGQEGVARPPEHDVRALVTPQASAVVPRWVQLVLLPLGLLGVWALARAAGAVLLIFIVASLVALILAPVVRLLERRIPRGLAILLVYLAGFGGLGGVGFLLVSPVSTQVRHFEQNLPQIIQGANRDLANVQSWLNQNGISVHIQKQGQTALQTLQRTLLKRSSAIVTFSRDLLASVLTIGFDLVLVLVLSVYLLLYGRQIGELVRRVMPAGDGSPADDFPLLVQQAVSGYVRGQLLFSLVMGASAAVALTIFGLLGIFADGERYAVFLAVFYGLMELIPYIGPVIGPVPAVLLALFTNPISAVWLIILFVALQQLEGHVVAPQVFRISLRINPIVIILALLTGYQLYGVVGALVALPVIAVLRQTVIYLRRHVVLEPWGTQTTGIGLLSAESRHCPACGAVARSRDRFCRACGAPQPAG